MDNQIYFNDGNNGFIRSGRKEKNELSNFFSANNNCDGYAINIVTFFPASHKKSLKRVKSKSALKCLHKYFSCVIYLCYIVSYIDMFLFNISNHKYFKMLRFIDLLF